LIHQKRLQPAASFSQDPHKIRLRHEKRVDSESASEISFKPHLVQEGKTAEPTGVPVAEFRFTGSLERQPYMGVLRMFRPSRPEEEKSGHPELGYYIATGSIIGKS
jgi:hypothetical protein